MAWTQGRVMKAILKRIVSGGAELKHSTPLTKPQGRVTKAILKRPVNAAKSVKEIRVRNQGGGLSAKALGGGGGGGDGKVGGVLSWLGACVCVCVCVCGVVG